MEENNEHNLVCPYLGSRFPAPRNSSLESGSVINILRQSWLSMPNRRFTVFLLSSMIIATSVLAVIGFPESLRVSASSPTTIILVGFTFAWNNTSTPNPTITVTFGQDVTIQLSSGDGVLHRFFVDVDKNGPTPDCPGADVCSTAFPPSTSLTFTVNFAPGTYTYYCSVHPTTMLGKFIVVLPPVTGQSPGGRHQFIE